MLRKLLTTFSRRPFPRNLHALRSCRISYGQFGEDLLLTHLLGYEKTDGTYVDVGCFHPVDYSNTYIFYQRGWSGVAIDPNPTLRPLWERYRPRDRFINAAASDREGSMTYAVHRLHPACNRLLPQRPETPPADCDLLTVPARPINAILAEQIPDRPIDLLNIDCEGHDLVILQTLNFARHQPRVIAAEDAAPGLDSPLCTFLAPLGYRCEAHIGLTKIFAHHPRQAAPEVGSL